MQAAGLWLLRKIWSGDGGRYVEKAEIAEGPFKG